LTKILGTRKFTCRTHLVAPTEFDCRWRVRGRQVEPRGNVRGGFGARSVALRLGGRCCGRAAEALDLDIIQALVGVDPCAGGLALAGCLVQVLAG